MCPSSPLRSCSVHRTTFRGRCPGCALDRLARKERASQSRTYDDVLSTVAWRKLSKQVLSEEPVCRLCGQRPSAVADHIVRRRDRPDLALIRENLRGVCRSCHGSREWGSRDQT